MKTATKKSNVTRVHSIYHTMQVGAEVNLTGRAAGGALLWAGLLRRLDRLDPGYAS